MYKSTHKIVIIAIISITLLVTLPVPAFSAETVVQLEASLKQSPGQPDILVKLVTHYRQEAPDKARQYGEQALEILEKSPNDEIKMKILNGLCWAYGDLGEYRKALDSGNQAVSLAKRLDSRQDLVVAWSTLANIYVNLSQYHKALDYSLKATSVSERIGYERGHASALVSTARLQLRFKEYANALANNKKALAISKKLGNWKNVALIYNNIGTVYWEKKQHQKALEFYREGLKIMEEVESLSGKAYILLSMACVYNDTGNSKAALRHDLAAMKIYRKLDNKNHIVSAYRNLGRDYANLGDNKRALQYYDRALAMTLEMGTKKLEQSIYAEYTRFYERNGDFRKALFYYKKLKDTGESMLHHDRNKEIAHLQVVYDVEKKQKENLLLKKNNTIQSLELEHQGMALDRQRLLGYFLLLVIFLVAVIASITYNRYRIRKKAQKVLQESETKLKRMNNAKDKLFAIIAHDLGNPLNSLLLSSGHLKRHFRSLPPEDLEEFIQNIHGQTESLSDLLENLLQWALVQTGKITYSPETVDLRLITEETLEHIRFNANKKQVNLVSNVIGNTEAWADKQMMKSVLRNLVSNAVKYTHPGGEIIVSSSDSGETIEVSVSDTGVGIDETRAVKLFKEELHESTRGTVNEKGTGLGLTLCKEFVETNGGEIRVRSQVQKGSTFSFTLPKQDPS